MNTQILVEPKTQTEVNTQFIFACVTGKLESIIGLLTSEELSFHADLKTQEIGLKKACQINNADIIKYLIIDFNMPISADMKKWLRNDNSDDTFYCYAFGLLEKRELNEKLNESLNSQAQPHIKPKSKL